MPTISNRVKEQLDKGELALGLGLRACHGAEMGRVLSTCGFDFAFIDLEHSALSTETAAALCIACQDAGVTPLVRVPGYEHYLASRMLDAGAMGIIFPHVDTPDLARELVSYCKFPPQGRRSSGGPLPQLNFQAVPQAEALAEANRQTMIVIMVESPEGVENAEAIAAVKGVDVVLIGTNDLCLEMGIPQQFGDPKVAAAFERVISACKKHGKIPGFGGVYDETHAAGFVQKGMRMILAGGDLGMLMAGARHRSEFLRGIHR